MTLIYHVPARERQALAASLRELGGQPGARLRALPSPAGSSLGATGRCGCSSSTSRSASSRSRWPGGPSLLPPAGPAGVRPARAAHSHHRHPVAARPEPGQGLGLDARQHRLLLLLGTLSLLAFVVRELRDASSAARPARRRQSPLSGHSDRRDHHHHQPVLRRLPRARVPADDPGRHAARDRPRPAPRVSGDGPPDARGRAPVRPARAARAS